jgi:hypothetical protein
MLVVETIAKIRRMHFGQGMGIKTICRELNLSKKVVRKVVWSGATEFSYKRTVQPRPKLGAWLAELDRLLVANATRASRERLTVMQLCEELQGLGYAGSFDAVRRYAAAWKQARSMLLQDADDLLFASYRSLHRPSLPWRRLQSLMEELSRSRSGNVNGRAIRGYNTWMTCIFFEQL